MNFWTHKLFWILPALIALAATAYFLRHQILKLYRSFRGTRFVLWLRQEETLRRLKHIGLALFGVAFVVALLFAVEFLPGWELARLGISAPQNSALTTKDYADLHDAYRKTILQALAGIFAFVALYYTHRRVKVAEQGHITERYTKAIEQLGAVRINNEGKSEPNLEVRLGAIYALERIARDSAAITGPSWKSSLLTSARTLPR